MDYTNREIIVAEFVGLKKKTNGNYIVEGKEYTPFTLKFGSDFNWLIRAVRKYLDIDYATVKNSESIDLIVMYKKMLRERSVFTDEIQEIFELLVVAIVEYNKIKR